MNQQSVEEVMQFTKEHWVKTRCAKGATADEAEKRWLKVEPQLRKLLTTDEDVVVKEQPIYVIQTSALGPIIDLLTARYTRSQEWGYRAPNEVLFLLCKLEERVEGWMDCAKVSNAIYDLHTSKMIGGANRALIALVKAVNAQRDTLKKV